MNNNGISKFGGLIIGLGAAAGYLAYSYLKKQAEHREAIDISQPEPIQLKADQEEDLA